MRFSFRCACIAATSAAIVVGLDSGAAAAFVVNISGTNYNVTTFEGSYNGNITKFETPSNGGVMPWWGNSALAEEFATLVGNAFGNNVNVGIYGPYFAEAKGDVSAGEDEFYAYALSSLTGNVTDVNPKLANVYIWAQVTQAESVPGPLPLFGAAAAFGMSRRLRRRIRLDAGSNQG